MHSVEASGILGTLIGPKRRWWAYKARMRALPEPYRHAVDAVERYLMHFGPLEVASTEALLENVADLFERAAADRTPLRELVGSDPVEFVEALIRNYSKGGYVDRERKRLVDALTEAPAPWRGMVPVADSALYVQDTGGRGPAVLYLNGSYADQSPWRPVIAALGDGFRHIGFAARARGRSKTSSDYSLEGMLRDVEAVLDARGVERALVVGWSLGGVLAWQWADRHPERVLGSVIVDAFPIGLTGADGEAKIRQLFARWRLLLPIAAAFGLAARMSSAQHAEVNIECNALAAASAPVLARASRPTWFVLATGDSLGSGEPGEMEAGRAVLDALFEENPQLRLAAKVSSNHTGILKRDSGAVARAIRELAVNVGVLGP